LDLLRFCAALSVAFYHLCKWPDGGESVKRVAQLGFLGVQVFFMISGFVILMTAEHRTPLQFANSRVARLYPTFWICVVITSIALWLHHEPPSALDVAANLTMVPPLLHQPFIDLVYWTLVVELRFYLLMLLLLLFGQMRRIETWLMLWVAALVAAHLPLAPPLPLRALHALQWLVLGDYGALFAAGCGFYLVRTRGASLRRLLMLACCLLLSIYDVCHVQDGSSYPWSFAQLTAMALTVAVSYGLFLTIALRRWRLPHNPLWAWLGGLTYPLYLIHAQTGRLVWLGLPGNGWLRSALVLALALLVAAVLARFSERRACRALQGALDRWEQRLRPKPSHPPQISAADTVIK
jgi:peptidoglycan/LPS O-acetylase OafA/YrhL